MTRKIRISVEIYDHHLGDDYEDLPDGWDDWTQAKQEEYLVNLVKDYLANAAGAGASVVEVPGDE
ncbi:hypothetical protein [Thermomonospora cellulosilytica]|uniref:Uncharacterized protein n=1 Tax=Thermomonospora cellulosilytica TaxID=1411118 RepID=A0A7W3R8G4_9ACTN|nr:hypothetical protein [Thermomonospora cellulosilytica]MBA9003691.1 hypothetical protein [Thermomonospora cellulosilytica]